jgi:hypothetical protein
MPEDAKEVIGHGVRAKRSKSGAVSFDLLEAERAHAALRSSPKRQEGAAEGEIGQQASTKRFWRCLCPGGSATGSM